MACPYGGVAAAYPPPVSATYAPPPNASSSAPVAAYHNPPVSSYVSSPISVAAAPTSNVAVLPPAGGVSISLAQGWNLVSGPDGTILNGNVGSIFTLQAGDQTYQVLPAGTPLRAGFAYWAFFPNGMTNSIPLAPGKSATVQLPPGQLVMVGNPGSGNAFVTGTDYMVVYNPATQQFVETTTLGPGQGGWAWSANGGTATIQSS